MYRTEVTSKYTFPTKESSWELSEKIFDYIKKNTKGYLVTSGCDTNEIFVTCLNNTLPIEVLDAVQCYIPSWAKEIQEHERKQKTIDIMKVSVFVDKFKMPILPKDSYKYFTVCERLLDAIADRYVDIEREFKKGEANVFYVDDIKNFVSIFHCAKKGDYKSAYKMYRSLDTTERELIMDAMHLFEEIKGY